MATQAALTDLSLSDFLDRLAAGEPTPGGGSAAALAGSMAAALASMVSSFTIGKPEFAAVEAEVRTLLDESEAARAALEYGVEADAAAFGEVASAYRLPRGTDAEKRSRSLAIQAASQGATRAPLEVARLSARLLDICSRLAEIGNPRVLADIVVAAHLAHAALRSAAANVEVNLPQLKDDPFADEARAELKHVLDGRDAQLKVILARVAHR